MRSWLLQQKGKSFAEEIIGTKVAGLQSDMNATHGCMRMAPRHTRINLRTDL
jgi:lipoprotein-anchoring transpeptidase ErfK/SrfK